MNLSETFVEYDGNGDIFNYHFIDTSKTEYKKIPDRMAFSHAVSFAAYPKGLDNYPVVFEDFTTSGGAQLHPIDKSKIPASIKRKLTIWLKYQ